jgi:integrase-like protein
MGSEAKWFCERYKLYELIEAQPDWSYHHLARQLGHSPKWVRKWAKRFRETPNPGFQSFCSQSRAPKTPSRRISEEAKDMVVQLREELSEEFQRKAGAETILFGIERLKQQKVLAVQMPKSPSTISRILHERGFILPRPVRWREPLILPQPMEEWEVDFGEIRLNWEETFEFFMVVDRGTSRLVYLEGSYGYRAETALEALYKLFLLNGLPQRLRFDRDPRLWGAWTRDSYPSPMLRFLRVLGIEPIACPPRRPDKKPVIERLIFTFKHEWLRKHAPQTLGEALDACDSFPAYYNRQRPHQGRACRNRPPDEAFPSLPVLPQLPETVNPDAWLNALHRRVFQRRVSSEGMIQVDRHFYFIGREFAKQALVLLVDLPREEFVVMDGNEHVLKRLAIQGLQKREMDMFEFLKFSQQEAHFVDWHYQTVWQKQPDTA